MNPAGTLLWRLNVGYAAEANGVAVDSAGNIFITGSFEKDALFSPEENLDFYIESKGGSDIFVLKVSSDGEPVWVVQAGGRVNISIQLEIIRPPDIDTFDNIFHTNNFGYPLQWLNCADNFSAIPGDTLSEFTPTETGSYAVEVTYSPDCRDTSECIFIQIGTSNVSEKLDIFEETQIFPNPFSEKINLKNLPAAFAEISIFGLNGNLIFEKEKASGMSEIEISTDNFSKGIYVIFIKNKKSVFRKKITKTDR